MEVEEKQRENRFPPKIAGSSRQVCLTQMSQPAWMMGYDGKLTCMVQGSDGGGRDATGK